MFNWLLSCGWDVITVFHPMNAFFFLNNCRSQNRFKRIPPNGGCQNILKIFLLLHVWSLFLNTHFLTSDLCSSMKPFYFCYKNDLIPNVRCKDEWHCLLFLERPKQPHLCGDRSHTIALTGSKVKSYFLPSQVVVRSTFNCFYSFLNKCRLLKRSWQQ